VHACHGAARQVDVLREVLVGLLEDDPTLEPRDILVMCPDIETFAPLISAGFGLADVTEEDAGHPAHRLRVRLADRSIGATNPLLGVASTLVELAGGRLTASQVLDLASAAPVRRRFGLGDDELERIARWVRDAGIRWGHDGGHRAQFGLQVDTNTWEFGLKRVLLGAALSGQGHRFVGGSLPVDDVGDGELELAGALAELVDRLQAFCSAAREASTVAEWTGAVGEAVHRLTATAPDDTWQVAQLDRELSRISASTEDSGTRLRHADVRSLLRHRLRGRPTRSNFRTGTLTVCTMVPMRSVPHRVVCLVGLDDGVFPRVQSVDGDDVLARRPLTGERDLRSEDRQLLLDAVAAATETLVVTYTGRGEHTGTPRPPAVPLGELLDALDATAHGPVRATVVHHPLQSFDEANLVRGRLVPGTSFTFDESALRGARAARSPRLEVRALVPDPLPAAETPGEVSLADLQDFLAHPVRAFLRGRLGISRPFDADEVKDGIPITLDSLEQWAVGDRLVRDVLAGAEPQAGMTAELLRGLLPPHEIGRQVLGDVVSRVRPLVTAGLALRTGSERTLDVDIDLGGRRLTGTVGPVHGNNLVTVSFSNLAAKHRITAWVDALALAAGHPDESWTAHTIGKHRTGGQVAMVPPVPPDDAVAILRRLVTIRDQGLCEPLPLPIKTSLAWAEEHRFTLHGRDARPDDKARMEWVTPRFDDSGFPKEDADAWHVRAFGEHASYDALLAAPCRDGESDGPHRLGHYAWQLWGALLSDDHEQIRAV
jgi:exodeoxyribonuclease V gamma subunit